MRHVFNRFFSAKHRGGFSLVELIAASAIIALTILVLVGVLRKGRDISASTMHRQRARAIIDSCFESPSYSFHNYSTIPTKTRFPVLIESRLNNPIGGFLDIDTVPGSRTTTTGDPVVCKRVYMSVSWKE
jgi:prepilin-type N-terminal cleavage/methylation domain-containing protein